jgi:transcriptional regulator with XRE-family HTH domain
MRRLDTQALHRALEERRKARGMTWSQVAEEVGVSIATIQRLRAGGRMEVDGLLAMVGWLGVPVENFVRDV